MFVRSRLLGVDGAGVVLLGIDDIVAIKKAIATPVSSREELFSLLSLFTRLSL